VALKVIQAAKPWRSGVAKVMQQSDEFALLRESVLVMGAAGGRPASWMKGAEQVLTVPAP